MLVTNNNEEEEGFDEFQDATPSSNIRDGTLSNDQSFTSEEKAATITAP